MAKHFWFSFTGERTTVDTDTHDAVKVKSCHNHFFYAVQSHFYTQVATSVSCLCQSVSVLWTVYLVW